MRNLFIVLAKVVGLLQVAAAIGYTEHLTQQIYGYVNGFSGYMNVVGVCVPLGLTIGFSWALLFQSTWIADRLAFPEGELNLLEPSSLLKIGIKLLGTYILVEVIPDFVWFLMAPKSHYQDPPYGTLYWIRILPTAIKLAFGLILVINTTSIMKLISRDGKPKDSVSI
jgi:hypothetical protein